MYLNSHSFYSFRYGTLSPDKLLEEARLRGIFTLCLSDINSTAGCLEFVRQAPKYGIRPILGVDIRDRNKQLYIAIAENNLGYQEINQYLSGYLKIGSSAIPSLAPDTWQHVTVIYPWESYQQQPRVLKPNEWIGVKPDQVNYLHLHLKELPHKKLVALVTTTFRNKRDHNTHRLLRAIDENTLLSKMEAYQTASDSDRFYSPAELSVIYSGFPELLLNAQQIAGQCQIFFDFSENRPHQNLKTYTGSEAHDFQLIIKLCDDGLSYRYKKVTTLIRERIQKELETIRVKGFVAYFLINWDILRYARSRGYFYVGRGSGANSIVAYLLRITDVDPIELDLYFERFINLYRTSPPDFDLDFSWRDREDITQYIFKRFPNASLLATYSTFQFKAVVRELGKVFGLPPIEIEEMSAGGKNGKIPDQLLKKILGYSQLINDFPSHLSIHAGGILIGEKPINYFTATHIPPKGFPTTMFDMVIAEDIGLFKFDILSQRGLGKIKDSLQIIRNNHPQDPKIDIHDIERFKKDERVKDLLREGKAIGCFYVESPAMRMLLKKLKVDNYLGLVAASSIIRPGVARSGMMREYILRFRFPEKRKEAHPVMLEIMPETFGIMVYQEDVIKVAHIFAGLSLAEADVLRRGMSGKFRSRDEFQGVREQFFNNCKEKGYEPTLAESVWHQIESFAGYAFSKGHSASYAVESYQSLFLKAYYPLEYLVATLNNGGGFYRPELYAHEAKMHGGVIEAPCVNRSHRETTITSKAITLGLESVKDLESPTIERILNSRSELGEFKNLEDLVMRTGISLDQLTLLLRVGGLRYTEKTKQSLMWDVHFLYGKMGGPKSKMQEQQLFGLSQLKDFDLPALTVDPLDNALDELELIGYPLCDPFKLLGTLNYDPVMASELPQHSGQTVVMLGYLIATKNTRTAKGESMHFGTFVDQEGSFIDTIHFPSIAKKNPFRGNGFYRLNGKVVDEYGFYSLEVVAMEKEPQLSTINAQGA